MNDLAPLRTRAAGYLAALAGALATFSASAAVVDNFPLQIQTSTVAGPPTFTAYNQPNNSTGFYNSVFEYGVQATLDGATPVGSVLRVLSLPYFSNYSLPGGLTYRLYANNGPLVDGFASPGSLLSERTISVAPGGAGNVQLTAEYDFSGANVLPSTVTVTVQFSGIGGANQAGWFTSTSANTAGSHPDFFWEKDLNSNWTTRTFAVPEPDATMAAGALALAGFAAVRLYRRKVK